MIKTRIAYVKERSLICNLHSLVMFRVDCTCYGNAVTEGTAMVIM
jgi:hypothetical protein